MKDKYKLFFVFARLSISYLAIGLAVTVAYIGYSYLTIQEFSLSTLIITYSFNLLLIVLLFLYFYYISTSEYEYRFSDLTSLFGNETGSIFILMLFLFLVLGFTYFIDSHYQLVVICFGLYLVTVLVSDIIYVEQKTSIIGKEPGEEISRENIDAIIERLKAKKDYHGEIVFDKWLPKQGSIYQTSEIDSKFKEISYVSQILNSDSFDGFYAHQVQILYKYFAEDKNLFVSIDNASGKSFVLQSIAILDYFYNARKSIYIIGKNSFINYKTEFEKNLEEYFDENLTRNLKILYLDNINNFDERKKEIELVDILFLSDQLVYELYYKFDDLSSFLKSNLAKNVFIEDLADIELSLQMELSLFTQLFLSHKNILNQDPRLIITSIPLENVNAIAKVFFRASKFDSITSSSFGQNEHKILFWLPTLQKRSEEISENELKRNSFITDSINLYSLLSTLLNRKILLFDPSSYLSSSTKENVITSQFFKQLSAEDKSKIDATKLRLENNLNNINDSDWDQFDAAIICGHYKDLIKYYTEIRKSLKNYAILFFVIAPDMLTKHFYQILDDGLDEYLSSQKKRFLPILFNDESDEFTEYQFCIINYLFDKNTYLREEEIEFYRSILKYKVTKQKKFEKYFTFISIKSEKTRYVLKKGSDIPKIPAISNSYTYTLFDSYSNTTLKKVHKDVIKKYYVDDRFITINDDIYEIDEIDEESKRINVRLIEEVDQYSYFDSKLIKEITFKAIDDVQGLSENYNFQKNDISFSVNLFPYRINESISDKGVVLINESLLESDVRLIDPDIRCETEYDNYVIELKFDQISKANLNSLRNLFHILMGIKIPQFDHYYNVVINNNAVMIYCYVENNIDLITSLYNEIKDSFDRYVDLIYKIVSNCPCKNGCYSCSNTIYSNNKQKDIGKLDIIKNFGKALNLEIESQNRVTYLSKGIEDLSQVENLVNKLVRGNDSYFSKIFNGLLSINSIAEVDFFNEEEFKKGYLGLCYGTKRVAIKKGMIEKETLAVLAHEYAHNWQHDINDEIQNFSSVLTAQEIPYDGKFFIEGFAMWVEQRFLSFYEFISDMKLNDIRQYDEYGEGLDFYHWLEKKMGFRYVFNFSMNDEEAIRWQEYLKESGINIKIRQREKTQKTWDSDIIL